MNPACQSYTLRNENGGWLAQVVISEDGFLGIVSDYGNATFAWRAFGDNFKKFLCRLNPEYFATKMVQGIAYTIQPTKKIDANYLRMAEKVLPVLQKAINKETELHEKAFGEIK